MYLKFKGKMDSYFVVNLITVIRRRKDIIIGRYIGLYNRDVGGYLEGGERGRGGEVILFSIFYYIYHETILSIQLN